MQELIKITNKDGQQVVSARDLHAFLEAKKDFSNWIKHRIEKYGLIENQDYVVFAQKGENPQGGRSSTEYALTLDAAKELSMVEGNAKGKQARQYFIEMEKLAHAAIPKLPTAKELALMVVRAEEEREIAQERLERANKTIELQAPHVGYVRHVLNSESAHTTTTIAKELGMSAVTLNRLLHENKVQHWVDGHWVLYRKYQACELTKTRTHVYYDSEGKQKTSIQTVWTETGRLFIHNLFREHKLQKTG